MTDTASSNAYLTKDLDFSKCILHIDYDSFFASVEQQVNPKLRNRPIAVGGSSLSRGIVCAASREAKKFGIKTGMPLFKAKQICPELVFVKGDGSKYSYIQKESLKIFNKYTDLIEPFSIDEAFLDVTKTTKFFETTEAVAYAIKEDIRKAFGEYITCSIGVGPNKLLAKLVSDLKKPNGLVIVTKQNLQETLMSVELRDFCGIGQRLENRLNTLGIYSVEDLQNTPLNILYKEFGNVSGSFLKAASLGSQPGYVNSTDYKRPVKSVSHQHTLSKNTRDPRVILNNLRRLAEMVAKRLRNQQMVGKTIHLSLRDANKEWYGFRTTMPRHSSSGMEIYKRAEKLFWELDWKKETRLIGIGVTNLIDENSQMQPLFLEDQREHAINKTMDKINDRFGKFTIIPANTLKADETKNKISSFLRHE